MIRLTIVTYILVGLFFDFLFNKTSENLDFSTFYDGSSIVRILLAMRVAQDFASFMLFDTVKITPIRLEP